MPNSFNKIIKCGNKKCNYIATNKKINNLHDSFRNEIFDKCNHLNDKPRLKRLCVEKNKKTSTKYKKFMTMYNKRLKCIFEKCELNKMLKKSKKKKRKK